MTGDTAKSNHVRDEVAAILTGLNLDKSFFTQKLSSDRAHKLLPANPDAENEGKRRSSTGGENTPAIGTGFRRRPSMVARRFPDFDVYLTESLMPVLAQALDALGRQVSRMQQQGDKLDARVRARFNPITWLAQQLLRRHPRVADTPRRMGLYRNFRDWADQERGRRELLRSKSKVQEVFNGFMQNGVVGRNTLPSIVAAVDDSFFLGGALKDSKLVQDQMLQGEARGRGSRGRLGGHEIAFEQFWFKLANVVVAHDGLLLSVMQEGRRLHKLREEEQRRIREEERVAEEQRRKEEQENQRLLGLFSELYGRMKQDEGLKSILQGKRLTGEYLKPSDPEYASQALPHGSHVLLLEEFLKLLGLKTAREGNPLEGLEAEVQQRLFRQKVQHVHEKEEEDAPEEREKAEKEKRQKKRQPTSSRQGSKEGVEEDVRNGSKGEASEDPSPKSLKVKDDMKKRGSARSPSKQRTKELSVPISKKASFRGEDATGLKRGSTGPKKGSKETREEIKEEPEEPAFDPQKDRWWDVTMKNSWRVLQAAFDAPQDGLVGPEVLGKIVPGDFIDIKKKVDEEQQRIADGTQANKRVTMMVQRKKKPTMEELSVKYGMSTARLDFFHDLFESFLPPEEDGSPGVCCYPEEPAIIDKKTMFQLLKQIKPQITQEEFAARFRRIDEDKSGVIEFDEFVQWVYDDEVEVVGSAEKVKRSFEELASDMDVSVKLIMYVYDCFKFEVGEQADQYPKVCAALSKEQAFTLAQILVTKLKQKSFDKYWDMVDVDNKGSVDFDDFCELLDFEDMPEDVLQKYNSDD